MNSTGSPSRYFCMDHQGLVVARHTSTAGNVEMALSEKIALLLHPHVDVP